MKIMCIVNPVAGKGKALRVWNKVHGKVAELGQMDLAYTEYAGHGTILASQAVKQGYELVLAFGGDGTLNEVVNGLAKTEVVFGFVPAGTGNDFARSIGLSKDPLQAVEVIAAGKTKWLDLGRFDGQYFLNMGGLGFDADVAHRVNCKRILRGHLAYLVAVLQTLLVYNSYRLEVIIDDQKIATDTILVSVGNGQYLGGGFHFLPQAVLDDGQFDIMVVDRISRLDIMATLPVLYKGEHVNHPKCHFYRGREVTINLLEGNKKAFAQVDGQEISTFPLHFRIEPSALKVIVP